MAANPNDTQRRNLLQEMELINQRILEANRASVTATGQEVQNYLDQVEQLRTILRLNQDQLAVMDSMQNKTLKNLKNFDSIDDTLVSISNSLQNNVDLQQKFATKLNSAKSALNDIASIVETASFDDRQLKHIDNASDAYRNMNVSIVQASAKLAQGKIGQEQYNNLVQQSLASFDELVGLIDTSTESGKDLVAVFQQARAELDSFEKAAQRSAAALGAMDTALDQMGSSGIPLARELGDAIGDIAKNGTLGKAALIALGAAAGKLAYDYFGASTQAAIEVTNEVKINTSIAKKS